MTLGGSKKYILGYFILTVLAVSCAVWFYLETKIKAQKIDDCRRVSHAYCGSYLPLREKYFPGMRTRIVRILIENEIPPSELDFSLPGTPEFGDTPALEIFSEQNDKAYYSRWDMSKVSPDAKVFYTFGNRVKKNDDNYELNSEDVSDASDLIAVIPNVYKGFCNEMYGAEPIPEIPEINILPFPEEIDLERVVDLPSEDGYSGCIKVKRHYYYYHLLIER